MVFVKSFPKNIKGTSVPIWEEIKLSDEEEKEVERKGVQVHYAMMRECIDDARKMLQEKGYGSDENVISVAIALFEKRASHTVFMKEQKTREKFEEMEKKK